MLTGTAHAHKKCFTQHPAAIVLSEFAATTVNDAVTAIGLAADVELRGICHMLAKKGG